MILNLKQNILFLFSFHIAQLGQPWNPPSPFCNNPILQDPGPPPRGDDKKPDAEIPLCLKTLLTCKQGKLLQLLGKLTRWGGGVDAKLTSLGDHYEEGWSFFKAKKSRKMSTQKIGEKNKKNHHYLVYKKRKINLFAFNSKIMTMGVF